MYVVIMKTYEEIKNNYSEDLKKWNSPFFKQLFITSSVMVNLFIYGLYMGSITVMVPQIRREANSTSVLSPELVSWMSSLPTLSGLPWAIILPILAERFGRKPIFFILNLNTFVCNVIHYRSETVTELIVTEVMMAALPSSVTSLGVMILSEYTSPKYRGIFFGLKSATLFWGIWMSNTIGTFFHWKNICIVIFVCSMYNFTIAFHPESPYWLASKKRFEECAKSHRWLKGKDKISEMELNLLILTHKNSERNEDGCIIQLHNAITHKTFYKPVMYSFLVFSLYNMSGKYAYTIYAIDIIKKITSSEKVAYQGMLILDGVTVLGMYLGCYFIKILKRRTQLLATSLSGIGFLFVMSGYLYMVNLNIIAEDKYISIFLLVGFSISIGCGPMILLMSCHGELAPLKHRILYLSVTSIISLSLISLCLKISPVLFHYFDTHGAFLCFALFASFFIYLLYIYIPETKDKTIQEIEKGYTEDDCIERDEKDNETVPLN